MHSVHTTYASHRPACLLIFMTLLLNLQPATALSMKEAVALALVNDPTLLATQANLNVSRERVRQSVSELLPQLSASVNTAANRRNYTVHSQPPPGNVPTERYNSNAAQLNLTQLVWRHSSLISISQANQNAEQADYQMVAATQDMLVRLSQAWFDVMQARDSVIAAEAQSKVAQQQLQLSQRAHEKGVLSLTELEDAHTKQIQAFAEHSIMQSEIEIKLATLEQIVGPVAHTPPVLSNQFNSPTPSFSTLDQWLKQIEECNPAVLAAQRAVNAANEEIRKQRAGHEPTLELVASYGKSAQAAGISGGQLGFDTKLTSIGLQLNVPLYAGGLQNSKVREALALRDKAIQELETTRRNARLTAKQSWFNWQTSGLRESLAKQAIRSSALALSGAQSARSRGVKADIDVLQAQQQHATALRDWHKARYDSITSQLKLKASSGQLSVEEIIELDKSFSNIKESP